MEILQLRYFCDAAETENFSKTAKKFNVPPSNISQTIKRLENELGVYLFNRKSNSLILNEQGKMFYEKINKSLRLMDEAIEDIWESKSKGKIKICIITNRRIVMQVTEKFRKLYPEVTILLSHTASDEEFDLVIADDMYKAKGMQKQLIISENISLAIPKVNPLSQKTVITVEDISNESFISMNSGSSLCEFTRKMCADMGFEPNIVIQSDDPFYVRKCVELGLGIAFIPSLSWKGQFSDNVVVKNINNCKRNTYAFSYENRHIKQTTKQFLKLLRQECDNEIKKTFK